MIVSVPFSRRSRYLTQSTLHRCRQRHGISRLQDVEGDNPKRQQFKRNPIGFFISVARQCMFTRKRGGISEVQTSESKLRLFVGIDRTSKFAVTQLVDKAGRKTAWEFLEHLLRGAPFSIHTILPHSRGINA